MGKQKNENIHDKFFKSSFSIKEVALGFVYEFLPKEIHSIIKAETFTLQAASYVNKKLSEKFSDIIYKVQTTNNTEIFLTFLFEHKSAPDKFTSLQILRYMLDGWEKQLKQEKELHLILPIVVYHGKQKWQPKKIDELIKIPNSNFKKYIPIFDFAYVDTNQFTEDRLLTIANFIMLRNTMMTLKYGRNEKYILNHIGKLFIGGEQINNNLVGTNFLDSIFVYIVRVNNFEDEKLDHIIEILENPVKDVIMTTYDRLIQRGVLQGVEKGIEQGIEKGIIKKNTAAVKNMIIKGFDNQTICEIQDVSDEFVNNIRKAMN